MKLATRQSSQKPAPRNLQNATNLDPADGALLQGTTFSDFRVQPRYLDCHSRLEIKRNPVTNGKPLPNLACDPQESKYRNIEFTHLLPLPSGFGQPLCPGAGQVHSPALQMLALALGHAPRCFQTYLASVGRRSSSSLS